MNIPERDETQGWVFEVGMHVLCDLSGVSPSIFHATLVHGRVYTVKRVDVFQRVEVLKGTGDMLRSLNSRAAVLWLEEIWNPVHPNITHGSFSASLFRPLTHQKVEDWMAAPAPTPIRERVEAR